MNIEDEIITELLRIFRQYKTLAEKAIEQITEVQLFEMPKPDSNSIAIIMEHINGNLKSRFTDFYTSDGEKPHRNRDNEFITQIKSKQNLLDEWSSSWQILFDVIDAMTPAELQKSIFIRGEPHSVYQAMQRQIAHYAYHIGQIIYCAKIIKGDRFISLSIPKGKSHAFNASKIK